MPVFKMYERFPYLKISFDLAWLRTELGEEGVFWRCRKAELSSVFLISGFEKLQKQWRVCGSEPD